MRRPAVALTLALLLAGCAAGGDEDATPTPTPTATPRATPTATPTASPALPEGCDVAVDIRDFAYAPQHVEVASGATVCWTNRDTVPHTVTFEHGMFDSGSIAPGETVMADLEDGLHGYHCTFHASMTGSVQVGPAEATPPPTPSPTPSPSPSPSPSPATPAGPATAGVNILAFTYAPQTVTIARGGTVTWTNQDAVPHTATATDGTFDTGSLAPATGSKTIAFPDAGTFDYRCSFHTTMTGKVVVN